MLRIKFRYIDKYTNGKWAEQECYCNSVKECIEIYGLESDPTCYQYEILEVEEA